MEEERGGPVGPFEDLEVIRLDAGMPTSRFVDLIGVPERSCRRWQAKARTDRPRARGGFDLHSHIIARRCAME